MTEASTEEQATYEPGDPFETSRIATARKGVKFAGASTRRHRVDRDQIDLFFSQEPLPEDRPLLLFQHIRKTAGTTTRGLLEANLSGARHLYHYSPTKDLPAEPIAGWYEAFWNGLRRKEQASLICAASHTANYLIPLLDRPFRAMTIIREPVDRVLSRYFFYKTERRWDFHEYFAVGADETRNPEFCNGQARALLAPHYDVDELGRGIGPPPDADLWRIRLFRVLAEHYSVGLQEHWEQTVATMAELYGLGRLEIEPRRLNPRRPDEFSLDAEARELVLGANWLDAEMYAHYADFYGVERDEADAGAESQSPNSPGHAPSVEALAERLDALEARSHAAAIANRVRISALERRLWAHDTGGIEVHLTRKQARRKRAGGEAKAGRKPRSGRSSADRADGDGQGADS